MSEEEIKETNNQEPEAPGEEKKEETQEPKENYINNIVKKQMEDFQEQFINQFQEQFNDKINKFEEDKKEFQSAKQKHKVKELLMENNLESELLDFVYADDIEIVEMKIEEINKIISNRVEYIVKERLKETSYTPPSNDEGFKDKSSKKPPYMV